MRLSCKVNRVPQIFGSASSASLIMLKSLLVFIRESVITFTKTGLINSVTFVKLHFVTWNKVWPRFPKIPCGSVSQDTL